MQSKSNGDLTRRQMLALSGALLGWAALPRNIAHAASSDVTGRLARYMVSARDRPLPPDVVTACKHRILDTFGAMVSGSRMKPGIMAVDYVRGLGGSEQASIVGSDFQTTAVNAALANAMCAHADETDDSSPSPRPIPAALPSPPRSLSPRRRAVQARSSSGPSRLGMTSAVVCCGARTGSGARHAPERRRNKLHVRRARRRRFARPLGRAGHAFAISYAAQQVSGLWSWVKDEDHVEKAFDFSGMGARNGVTAVSMVEAGMTGVADVLDGTHNLFIALSTDPKPEEMVKDLGTRFYVTETAIKTFSVGYPNQSALDAFLTLRKQYGLTPDTVQQVLVKLPTDAVGIVGNSAMPDVSCQHLIALALVKGAVSFADSHDHDLMHDPVIVRERSKVELVGDRALMDPMAPRGSVVEVTLSDGRKLDHYTKFPPGTKENPLTTETVNAKVRDLIAPVLGASKADSLIERLNALETLDDLRKLRPLMT